MKGKVMKPKTKKIKTKALLKRGYSVSKKGHLDKALFWFATNPCGDEAYAAKAYSLVRKGDHDAAISVMLYVISIKPKDAYSYFLLGEIYRLKGDTGNALKYLYQAIKLEPKYALAYGAIGEILADIQDYHAAISNFNIAISLYQDMSKIDLNNAQDINRDLALVHEHCACVHLLLKNIQASMQNYDRAIVLDPECSSAYFFRGNLNLYVGDLDQAQLDYEAATILGFHVPRDMIEQLENAIGLASVGAKINQVKNGTTILEISSEKPYIAPASPNATKRVSVLLQEAGLSLSDTILSDKNIIYIGPDTEIVDESKQTIKENK